MNRNPSPLRSARWFKFICLVWAALLLGGCVTPKAVDYTAFQKARPASILVLPPINQTVDLKATHSVYAQTSRPLAESGYYVLPVSLVDETLKENGVTQAQDAHELPSAKLREIFGADAVLYIAMTQYGTVYQVLDSHTTVTAEARLVDLKTDKVLWTGKATASTAEQKNQQQQKQRQRQNHQSAFHAGFSVASVSALAFA